MGAVSEEADEPLRRSDPSRPGRAARRRARRRPPPLPQREGLDAVRWQVPRDASGARGALDSLRERFPALADPAASPLGERFARGEVVDADGAPWAAQDLVGPGDELWFHRELRAEQVPAAELSILHRDDHLLVLDKPHDMATMPRGAHVLSSALVRLRRTTGIETLVPLHRLDRRTAGVLAFGIRPEERSAYQQLFARGEMDKEYEARVVPAADSALPRRVGEQALLRDRLVRTRGIATTQVVPGEPNAETLLEVRALEADGTLQLRLRPRTGRTHQLRAQLAARAAPILGEDLYPPPPARTATEPPASLPLQLLARSLAFTDPLTGDRREFRSRRELAGALRTLGP
ncbi:pseudouridine synthase [Brachybacterium sp. UNK5269]|uniref:pseudouridine synthase n=1 Tax=Brachybacterium sp. UNK5269 TaxID=3408576 RepID=UPI003BAF0C8C